MSESYHFLREGTQAAYDALESYDDKVLYFCTDTKKIYKGNIDFTTVVNTVTSIDGITTPIDGAIYYSQSDGEFKAYSKLYGWVSISSGNTMVIEYCISDSYTELINATEWGTSIDNTESENKYIWQRVKMTKGSTVTYSPNETGVCITPHTTGGGTPGQNVISIKLDSSNGESFKNNTFSSTTIIANIYYGREKITTLARLQALFGSETKINWEYSTDGGFSYKAIPDSLISNDGFKVVATSDVIDLPASFRCNLTN